MFCAKNLAPACLFRVYRLLLRNLTIIMGLHKVEGLGILSPYNGESNGKDNGKLNGNWGNIGDLRNLI